MDTEYDVKKEGVRGALERLLPGGKSGYETFDQGDVKGASQDYQDWAYSKGKFTGQKKPFSQPSIDIARKQFEEAGLGGPGGGSFDYDSLGINPGETKDAFFDKFDHNRKFMSNWLSYGQAFKPGDARFDQKDYSRKYGSDKGTGDDWERLAEDLKSAGLDVDAKGLETLSRDISQSKFGGDTGAANAVVAALKDVENKTTYEGDLTTQEFYDEGIKPFDEMAYLRHQAEINRPEIPMPEDDWIEKVMRKKHLMQRQLKKYQILKIKFI